MEENKEIVKWLSHIHPEASCTTVPNTMLDKHQLVKAKQQIVDKTNLQCNENPNLRYLRDAIAETRSEDTVLAKEISELISRLQINPQTMANDIKDNLQKLSMVLKFEGLSDTDEISVIVSMDRKRIQEKKRHRINRDLKSKYEELLYRHSVLEKKLNYLKKNVGLIRDSITENEVQFKNEYSSYKLMTAKLVEYNGTAGAIETDIDKMNLKELEPVKILNKYKKLMERKGQLANINQALLPYNNLPPNALQAKALLESKELEYTVLTQKFLSML